MTAFGLIVARHPHVDAHALAQAILSGRRFRTAGAAQQRGFWDEAWNWLVDRWHQVIDPLSARVHVGHAFSLALADIVVLALLALVVFVGIRLLALRVRAAANRAAARPIVPAADLSQLYAASLEAARAKRYRQAVALIFRAALTRLIAVRILRDDPSQTVNEAERGVRVSAPRLTADFARIAAAFTAAAYAESETSQTQWDAALNSYRALEQS